MGESDKFVDFENPFATKGRKIMFVSIIIIGTMLVALVSGTYNAVDNLTSMIKSREGFSSYEIGIIQSLCLMGAYFTFITGIILDRVGPITAISIGAIMVIGGYFMMGFSSFLQSGGTAMFLGLLLGYFLVGFGSGTTFLCALGTSIKALPNSPGLAISLPGICMSLSMAITIWIENGFLNMYYDCPDCWADAIFALLIFVMISFYGGVWLIAIGNCFTQKKQTISVLSETVNFEDDDYDVVYDQTSEEKKIAPATFSDLALIFFTKYYYVLSFGYFCAISYGLVLITQMNSLWIEVTGSSDGVSIISTLFSFANAAANIVCGLIYDLTVRKGRISNKVFMMMYFVGCTGVFLLLGIMTFFSSSISTSSFLQIIFASLMVLVGFGWGCAFTLFPLLTGEIFNPVNFGFNFSAVQLGSFIATFTVPNIAAFIYTSLGSYSVLFIVFSILFVVAGIISFITQPQQIVSVYPPWVVRIKAKIVSLTNKKRSVDEYTTTNFD